MNTFIIPCEHVIGQISNYIDGDIPPELRARIDSHLAGCAHCHAILDGARNIVALVADERLLELPRGFSNRLYHKMKEITGDSL